MAWDKASSELGNILENLLVVFNCQKKAMFGSPVYFVHNNMFTGVKSNIVFIRLSEADRKAIMADCDEVQPFEPRPGFVMKEYVEIPENKLLDQEFISHWLMRSFDYVSTLKPKVKKNLNKQL